MLLKKETLCQGVAVDQRIPNTSNDNMTILSCSKWLCIYVDGGGGLLRSISTSD